MSAQIYEQINHRLGAIEQRLAALESRVDTGFVQLESRVDQRFMWMMGLLIVSIVLPIAQRFLPH